MEEIQSTEIPTIVSLQAKIEALLLVHNKPLSIRQLVAATEADEEEVRATIEVISSRLNTPDSGMHLMSHDDRVQLVTAPTCARFVQAYVEDEHTGPLTRAQLETLSIIAYRGPVSRAEIEQIRGVNCSVILRNMMIRGFVVEKDTDESPLPLYEVTSEFLQHLGVSHKSQLPDFDHLSNDELLKTLIAKANQPEIQEESGQGEDRGGSNVSEDDSVSKMYI